MKPIASFVCASCRHAQQLRRLPIAASSRFFTTSTARPAENESATDKIENLMSFSNRSIRSSRSKPAFSSFLDKEAGLAKDSRNPPPEGHYDIGEFVDQPHRLHVYATKHNTHLTLTAPEVRKDSNTVYTAPAPNKLLMSLSAGNIGFRKAGRGSYDAGYQLAAFLLKQIQERGLLRNINDLEVVLRGFGAGREAVTKALLGQEGRLLRGKIKHVTDATRLKFGGPRSPKPRRLG